MPLTSATCAAIESCYDAVLEPSLWPNALQRLGESLGAQSCTLGTWNGALDPFQMPRSTGHEDFATLWLERSAWAPDPHITRGRRLSGQKRRFIVDHDLTTEEERKELPYFPEIAAAGRRHWWAAACFTVGQRQWSLPLYRSAEKGPFTRQEAATAAEAAQGLARVVRLAEKLENQRFSDSLDMLERFGCAALVGDEGGRLVQANTAALKLLEGGVSWHRGRLHADDGLDGIDLAAMISRALVELRVQTAVLRRIDAHPLLVEVEPSRRLAPAAFSRGAVLVTLCAIAPAISPDADVLAQVFGLTPAEARLAVGIGEGHGLQHAASAQGVTIETARSQLKAVFSKTGTSRQAELVNLLASVSRRRFSPDAE